MRGNEQQLIKQQLPRQKLINIKHRRIEALTLEDMILETHTRLTRISPVLSDMPKASGGNDKMSDGISRLIELKEKLDSMTDEVATEEDHVISLIKQMENPIHRAILYKLYILNENLHQVSVDISYNYHYTCRLHGHALNEYDKIAENIATNVNI